MEEAESGTYNQLEHMDGMISLHKGLGVAFCKVLREHAAKLEERVKLSCKVEPLSTQEEKLYRMENTQNVLHSRTLKLTVQSDDYNVDQGQVVAVALRSQPHLFSLTVRQIDQGTAKNNPRFNVHRDHLNGSILSRDAIIFLATLIEEYVDKLDAQPKSV